MSARTAAASALLALLALAPAASAHVTVAPSQVAPGSVVELAIRVPNERDVPTTKVEVQIPAGLEVFSFAEVPGWTRQATEASDGTLQSVAWTGSLTAGSYVSFDLLASTPDQPGELVFKAVQTYEGGEEAAWIGAPDSDEPAPVVEVTPDAAGSGAAEGDGHDDEAATTGADTAAASTAEAPATSAAEPTTVPDAATSAPAGTEVAAPSVGVAEDDDDTPAATWVALALGAAGLVAGVAALVVALRRRPGSGPSGGTPDAF